MILGPFNLVSPPLILGPFDIVAPPLEFTLAKEQLKISRTNDLVFLHDGSDIPVTAPKSPRSRIKKGFRLLGTEDDESIISHVVLINDQLVSVGQTVEGLTFHSSVTDGSSQVTVEISGGLSGKTYRLTLGYSTNYVPMDYRSQDFDVKPL